MNHKSLFLDTNIYLGYALDKRFEKYHFQCCHVFDKTTLPRHTSITVRGELHKKIKERKRFYGTLLKHCLSGKQLKQFNIGKLDKNERNHAEDVIAESHKEGKSDVEYVRSLDRLFFARVEEALLKRTAYPLVPCSNDAQMKTDFEILGLHHPDDSVLADFFSWAIPGKGSSFLTGDNKIHNSKTRIINTVESRNLVSCSHLSIDHVSGAIRNCP